MRSVQSLVISASMKQIVPLIAVKMWCWNPLRFYEGSSHLHGFILRYSQAVHNRWEIIIKKKKLICIYFSFLFDLELGEKNSGCNCIFMDSKLLQSWKWNVIVWSSVSLCFIFSIDTRENRICDMSSQNICSQIKIWAAILPLKWPRFGTKHHWFIPMQNFWQDSEHHVWIVKKKSKKGEGKKD